MLMRGRFGAFGGAYVPEILMPALEQLEAAFLAAQQDPAFNAELDELLAKYAGRPTPLTRCRNLGSDKVRIYLKREDLVHGGAHKTNQVLAQTLLARRMGQDPADRRDRRRIARRRHRDRRCVVRPRNRGLHGRARHGAAEAQRVPHAADGHQGGLGRKRPARAQGRDQRGAARLDRKLPPTPTICSAPSPGRIPSL